MMQKTIRIVDSLDAIADYLKTESFSRLFVLCDDNTKLAAFPLLEEALQGEWDIHLLEVPAGEQSKNWEFCLELWEQMSSCNADRKSLMLNLGGGVVTDLGAFVASIYKRGVSFIQLPTSLLAMTDAAIGGKCGIDFLNYKNQLGLFAKAQMIFIYPPFLKTLPQVELKSGAAEVLKHALIADIAYWEKLKGIDINQWQNVAGLIDQSLLIKNKVVENDPLEKGGRKKLNFGHTAGHAIESYFMRSGTPIPHGFAVAAGILIESWLSCDHAGLSIERFDEIAHVIQLRYAVLPFNEEAIEVMLGLMQQDKKSQNGTIIFSLLDDIGKAKIDVPVPPEMIRLAFEQYRLLYANN